MFLFAINAKVPRLRELPISESEPSFDAACMSCSRDVFTSWLWPLASAATLPGNATNSRLASSPYFAYAPVSFAKYNGHCDPLLFGYVMVTLRAWAVSGGALAQLNATSADATTPINFSRDVIRGLL